MGTLLVSLAVLFAGYWVARKLARVALTFAVVGLVAHAVLPYAPKAIGLVHHLLGV
jgi:hypothetical protein